MKYVERRPYADPEAAARKLMEIANSVEPVQDGRIHIELINWPMLHDGTQFPHRWDPLSPSKDGKSPRALSATSGSELLPYQAS
jgi:hypothetical protein